MLRRVLSVLLCTAFLHWHSAVWSGRKPSPGRRPAPCAACGSEDLGVTSLKDEQRKREIRIVGNNFQQHKKKKLQMEALPSFSFLLLLRLLLAWC